MTPESHARAKEISLTALARPLAEREPFLAEACGTDAALRSDVESLLAFHDETRGAAATDQAVTTRASSGQLVLPMASRQRRGASSPEESDHGVATRLVVRAARRLEIVCLVMFASVLVLWGALNFAQGELAAEFESVRQWGPPVAILASSFVMLAMARGRWFGPSTLVRLGLAYQVVVSFAIAFSSYLGAFEGMAPSDFDADRIGLSYVIPWTLFFTVLVPVRPREALLALLVSASAVPLVYLIQVWDNTAPALGLAQLTSIFVLPYVWASALAYVAARIVHQLGVEVRRADELGSYRLDVLLGRGGMGEVWRASHRMLARPAAIKLIRPEALTRDPALTAVAIARFEREAQVIASLQSPHTVELYDFGRTEDGALFYVMELLDGVDLDAFVRRFGPLPAARVVHLLRQACASLTEAHGRGLVHRDVKPANIYLCRRGIEHDVVKVLDFGLVTSKAERRDGLTRGDVVAGTPEFMAPEMALDPQHIDARADLYALGCVAFWLLTGRVLFEADTPMAAILAHVQHEPPRPGAVSELPVPEALDRLVLDCLSKNPAERPQTSNALAARLADVPLDRPWTEDDAARWWETHHPSALS